MREAGSCRVIPCGYWTRIDIGSGKYRGLVRVRRGMPWPVRLPYMPLEVTRILHLLTCIRTRTGRCCFTLFYSCVTPALLLFCNCCHPVLLKYMHVYTRVKHFTVELKQITTPIKLLARPGVVCVTIQCLFLNICIYECFTCVLLLRHLS